MLFPSLISLASVNLLWLAFLVILLLLLLFLFLLLLIFIFLSIITCHHRHAIYVRDDFKPLLLFTYALRDIFLHGFLSQLNFSSRPHCQLTHSIPARPPGNAFLPSVRRRGHVNCVFCSKLFVFFFIHWANVGNARWLSGWIIKCSGFNFYFIYFVCVFFLSFFVVYSASYSRLITRLHLWGSSVRCEGTAWH